MRDVMLLWNIIEQLDPEITPKRTKIHLASVNERGDDPLEIYKADPSRFREWQCWQQRKNFECDFVIALIRLPQPGLWLFAGAYDAHGCRPDAGGFTYRLDERKSCSDVEGRLVVEFRRPGRQAYIHAGDHTSKMRVVEMHRRRLSIPAFPGFKGLHVSKSELERIVREQEPGWKEALSSVAGVYLITDARSGKFYVGSATGEGGLWQRWSQYAATGHGGNVLLAEFLEKHGAKVRLHFSVLEIDDMRTRVDEIRRREEHWKDVLLTRIHGLNA